MKNNIKNIKIMSKIKKIFLTALGASLAFVFSDKVLAQSSQFFYGIEQPQVVAMYGVMRPDTPLGLEWWRELPLKVLIPLVLTIAALIAGTVILIKRKIIKRHAEKSIKTGQAETVDSPQGPDSKQA